MQRDIGTMPALADRCAMFIVSRILSVYPERGVLLIDCGWTGASAQGAALGYGEIVNHPELVVRSFKQQTGEVGVNEKKGFDAATVNWSKFKVGDLIRLAPYHACAGAHQHREIYVEQGGKVIDRWTRCFGG